MTEAEIRSTYEKKLKAHPALAESVRLRELARSETLDQMRVELGGEVRQPVPARVEFSRVKNRLLQNAQPTRGSVRNERKRMTAQRPWLARYEDKVDRLIRMRRKLAALEDVLNEEGVWAGTRHFFAMYINLVKIIATEERDLALTPTHEASMRASVAHTKVDLAALLVAAAKNSRNGNALPTPEQSSREEQDP